MFIIPIERVIETLDKQTDIKKFISDIRNILSIGKDYTEDHGDIFLSKKGINKLAFKFNNEKLLDLNETLVLEKHQEVDIFYLEIKNKIEEIVKKATNQIFNSENINIEDLYKLINIIEHHKNIYFNNNIKTDETISNSKFSNFISSTRDQAYKFASKTEDDAYKFASDMGRDAYQFTSDTRDKAHDFVMKTEDDAYKFASNMGHDAYQFASKGMEYGYRFASKGMEYGYQFASKGEEVGEMANRVLWMASEIGIMADRIGEMADRIVHTEHLIVQTAILIQNFGLLIDGTMKNFTDSILYVISMLLNKEFVSPQRDINITKISEITMEILKNNHIYDMAVLEKQSKLREITISALDKINKKY